MNEVIYHCINKNDNAIIREKGGSMIPHRLLNPNFEIKLPVVTDSFSALYP